MSKKDLPRVAVIISNYNYGEFVLEAIESALNQDYPNLEVVVVDDASTDDSIATISQHPMFGNCGEMRSTKDGNYITVYDANRTLTLITLNENGKQGRARNFGIREAWDRADYFAILDADDIMMPTKISRCIEKFLEYKDMIGSVHTDYVVENTVDGTITQELKPPYSKNLLRYDCHLHSGGVISKSALSRIGLFDEDVCPKEDYLMWLKISEYYMCVHVAEPLVRVRVSPKNTTDSISQEFHQKQYKLMGEKFQRFLDEKNKQQQ